MSQSGDAAAQSAEQHKPYISSETIIPEFSFLPVLVGALLGIVFGASSVYLVLKVGMTISASIPVAVISITLFRLFSKMFNIRPATILENNIVQTTGSAGESIAFGVGVTMPALMILGYDMEVTRVMTVSCLGGLLGILMMIPLRRGLIVAQHGKLTYPEGTACAEVLIVGEQGGTNAKTVFTGFGIGFIYKLLMAGLKLWKDIPSYIIRWYKGVEVAGEFSPELMGVGYIIGPATGCIMLAGGILATLVLTPLIKMFGEQLSDPIFPGTLPISAMTTSDIRSAYVLYIGAGAVATGGIISMITSLPLIFSSFKAGVMDIFSGSKNGNGGEAQKRTDRDMPMSVVVIGSLALVAAIWASPSLQVNLLGAFLIIMFGFLFVTVSSRLTGEIGSSSNPISGMTVSTLLLTCLIFLAMGWTGAGYRLTALSIAAVVCIAASNGGTTSQDLKTGWLIGATPYYQQIAILVGALSSAVVIGVILLALDSASTVYARPPVPFKYHVTAEQAAKLEPAALPEAERRTDSNEYRMLRVHEAVGDVLPGRYLVDAKGEIAYIIDPGINGTIAHRDSDIAYEDFASKGIKVDPSRLTARERRRGPMAGDDQTMYLVLQLDQENEGLPEGRYMVLDDGLVKYKVNYTGSVPKYGAPQAKLMSVIIDGILTQKLPWILVFIGAFIALIMELCQVSALPFAVGVYLPLSSSLPIFIGGAIRWLVDRSTQNKSIADTESSPGMLLSSGLIAGGAIAGIFIAFLGANENVSKALDMHEKVGALATSDLYPTLIFLGLGAFLFSVGRQWLFKPAAAPKE